MIDNKFYELVVKIKNLISVYNLRKKGNKFNG